MCTEVSSTKSKVTDVVKVREILISYEFDGVDFLLDEEACLEVVVEKEEGLLYGDTWPQALYLDDLPDRDNYPNHESWYEAISDVYYQKGNAGFLALLLELAPFLGTPLMILAASMEEGDCLAQIWRVQSGAKEVEVLDVFIG